ncbi:TlpA family protein disulfide reductase [Brevibacillus sp. H7]|uniref:TlpA family protein disulfide reductase n=1 Tax=Brevibacillus sp. H7 TaxID=3349138 RepID=UPI0037F6B30A
MKRMLLLVFFAALMGYTMYTQPVEQAANTEQKPVVGYQAPHFSLAGLDKQTYQLSGSREKPLVINFWASWCGPCRMEAPDLRKLYLKYRQQLDFYAVNVTSNDDPDSAKAFVDAYQLPFPIPMDMNGEVASKYRVNAFPTTYLVDKNGVIRQKIIGMIEPARFEQELKALISGKQ